MLCGAGSRYWDFGERVCSTLRYISKLFCQVAKSLKLHLLIVVIYCVKCEIQYVNYMLVFRLTYIVFDFSYYYWYYNQVKQLVYRLDLLG